MYATPGVDSQQQPFVSIFNRQLLSFTSYRRAAKERILFGVFVSLTLLLALKLLACYVYATPRIDSQQQPVVSVFKRQLLSFDTLPLSFQGVDHIQDLRFPLGLAFKQQQARSTKEG